LPGIYLKRGESRAINRDPSVFLMGREPSFLPPTAGGLPYFVRRRSQGGESRAHQIL